MHLRYATAALIAVIVVFGLIEFGAAQSPRGPLYPVDPWTPGVAPQQARRGPTLNIPLSTTNWTFLGPAPQNSGGANGFVSGRIAGIAADPGNANIIYVAAAGGGVWKTTNGGTNWVPLTDSFPSLSMGCIAVAPSNPNVIYAGTGEANNAADSNHGQGILVSTNAGASWVLRNGPVAVFSRRAIGKIDVDIFNANVAYAAVGGFAQNGLGGGNGIYKTTDGGVTWTNVTFAAGLDSNNPWSDVVVDHTNPNIVYAAIGNIFGAATNGVYKSIDAGAHWNLLGNAPNGAGTGRIAIALGTNNNLTLYVTVSNPNNNPNPPFGQLLRITRSDDGGVLFTDLTAGTPDYMKGQGWYDTTVTVDPTNSAVVIVAGSAGANSVLRSINFGVTWTDISGGAVSPHADHHAGVFDAAGIFLDGDDGGLYRLTNPAGPTWANLNGGAGVGLGTIQFEGVGQHPTDPNQAVGGSQDNGTAVFANSLLWNETDGGDGGLAEYNSTNGAHAYHQIPVASFGANFFRFSSNGGATWSTRTTTIVADQNFQRFYAPFIVDPANGNDVWYGTRNVWVSGNEGATWSQGTAPGVNGWNPAGANTSALGQANFGANFYAATGGTLFVTTNGINWTNRTAGLQGFINDIQVNQTNGAEAYVASGNFNGTTAQAQVFHTTNFGATWTNIHGKLIQAPVWSLALDTPNNIVYAGTERGVFFTNDNGAHWTRLGTGLPNAQVLHIEWNNTTKILSAATHGRGLWELSVPTPPTPVIEVKGNGTIAVSGGKATFNLDVLTPVPPQTVHTVSYVDQVHNFSINMTNVTSATLTGNHCHIVGTAQVNRAGPAVTITVDTFDNAPDQFFISSSTGYNAGGNLTSGNIVDE